jgi:hypothetical protein
VRQNPLYKDAVEKQQLLKAFLLLFINRFVYV